MIKKNDKANGIVQLSASAVSVHEPHTGAVVNVTRTAGDFGTVSEHEFGIRCNSVVLYMPRSLAIFYVHYNPTRPKYLRFSWLVSMPPFHSYSRLEINAVSIADVTPKRIFVSCAGKVIKNWPDSVTV